MTRIVHLTDLHFGAEHAALVAPLRAAIHAAKPEFLVVTGDLTHRARRGQFRAARGFLEGLGLPFVAFPGNHDVPLFNLPLRYLAPFRGWHREVSAETAPERSFGPLRIHCANTADPFSWRRGVFRPAELRRILAARQQEPEGTIPLLACHHPLVDPPGFAPGETRGGAQAVKALAAAGIRIVLSGHLHHWAIGLGIAPGAPQPVLIVQTGTALCAREGERDHGFSVLEIAPGRVQVTPWIVDGRHQAYLPRATSGFAWRAGGWHADPA